jgi:hypothetical protein
LTTHPGVLRRADLNGCIFVSNGWSVGQMLGCGAARRRLGVPMCCGWSNDRCWGKILLIKLMTRNMVALCKIWLLDLRRLARSQNGAAKHINGSCSVRMHCEGMMMHSMIGLFELSVGMYFFLLANDPSGSSMRRKRGPERVESVDVPDRFLHNSSTVWATMNCLMHIILLCSLQVPIDPRPLLKVPRRLPRQETWKIPVPQQHLANRPSV